MTRVRTPDAARPVTVRPARTDEHDAVAQLLLDAVYVERETRPGPDGALELEYNRLGVAPAARHTETDSAAPEARAALDAQTH